MNGCGDIIMYVLLLYYHDVSLVSLSFELKKILC
jgi:hypothetical protein